MGGEDERFFYEYDFGESYEGISLQFLVLRYPQQPAMLTFPRLLHHGQRS